MLIPQQQERWQTGLSPPPCFSQPKAMPLILEARVPYILGEDVRDRESQPRHDYTVPGSFPSQLLQKFTLSWQDPGYNQSKQSLRWHFAGAWSLSLGSAHLSLSTAAVAEHPGCRLDACTQQRWVGSPWQAVPMAFFHFSALALSIRILFCGTGRRRHRYCEQNSTDVTYSLAPMPDLLFFYKVSVVTGEMDWCLCFGKVF